MVLNSEVDEYDFSRSENVVWRRAIANMVFYYVLVKQRDALGSRGFIKKISMNMSDIRLILTYLRGALKCNWASGDNFKLDFGDDNLTSEESHKNKLKYSDTLSAAGGQRPETSRTRKTESLAHEDNLTTKAPNKSRVKS